MDRGVCAIKVYYTRLKSGITGKKPKTKEEISVSRGVSESPVLSESQFFRPKGAILII